MTTITDAPECGTQCAPRFVNHPAYRCLRVGDVAGFHHYTSADEILDLSGADLSGLDLRKVDLNKVIIRGAYLKEADLRGQDLRQVELEGCSLRDAKVSGAYFPDALAPQEILMSLQFGTRLRVLSR
jgi:uncharacterized protein YjbI with pentapeptide repeats